MQFLSAWVHDLVVVVALAAVVEMLMPPGNFRRFAVLVMGLLVVLALSKPLLGYMQAVLPVGDGTLRVVANPASGGYSFAAEGAALGTADAALREGLADHLSRLVASSLGLAAVDVRVEVGLEGRPGWPQAIRDLRVRVLRAPEALIEVWLASQDGGIADPGEERGGPEGPTRADALREIGEALKAQLAAIYRLDRGSVEVVMPR